MARGAFADDLPGMFRDFGEDVEVGGEVVCEGHFSSAFAAQQTPGQNTVFASAATLRVPAGAIPASVKPRNCRGNEYDLVLIGKDQVRRLYRVNARPGPEGDCSMETLEILEVVDCNA